MKLKFDPKQDYQLESIQAVTDLFEGQPLNKGDFEFSLIENNLNYSGVANNLLLQNGKIIENLNKIQYNNKLETSADFTEGRNFSIEMETGTGKTYVYLRTIFELNKVYGWKKFVIVVPSIAIKEGVLKNLEITQEHFQGLYENVSVNFKVYDPKNISYLRTFATSNNIEILVINIDSFAKDENIINRPNDKLTGEKPIKFIQEVNPIVIIDEPQNMETENRKKAVQNLNPCFTLRYSATHKNLYNLIYSLNPVKAYDLGLVKQIEVDSIITENSYNDSYIKLIKIDNQAKNKLFAELEIDVNEKNGVKRKSVKCFVGDDLYKKSNQRELYKEGYIINEINADFGEIILSNGNFIQIGQSQGSLQDEIVKLQIRKTIEEHLQKERRLKDKGIKVLSLFFIDKVANYRAYADKVESKGKLALWFEEIYNELTSKPSFQNIIPFSVQEIHNGYFSQDKKGLLKDTKGESEADNDTYSLIMRDKEKLLDINNPLRFIFSHSALREGWDNPNVFQICTINETKSTLKKRQEIGRGLRLAVNQNGERVFDRTINRLTVIANESYEAFAKQLQTEIEEESGISFKGRIKNKRDRVKVNLKKNIELDQNFLDLWDKIKHKTRYKVDFSTEELITNCVLALKEIPIIEKTQITVNKRLIDKITEEGLQNVELGSNSQELSIEYNSMPDILGYIQSKTELTRSTINKILTNSGRLSEIFNNPQLFLDNVVKIIKRTLNLLMVEGIKYEKITDFEYEMRLFEDKEIESYLENLHKVKHQDKTLYDHIVYDSDVERQFAIDCETREDIEFYIKLPQWFKIKTPIGNYNPDWALVMKNEKKLYFVAETKSTLDDFERRESENLKIKCGKKHFEKFENVKYKVVSKVSELV